MTANEEVTTKEKRVTDYLRSKKLEGVLLTRQEHFAWLTCGGANFVATASESGVATLLFMPTGKYVIANNIEMPRMLDEELGGLNYRPLSYPWHQQSKKIDIIRKAIKGKKVAADDGVAGTRLLGADFKALRYSLTRAEVTRYKALGRDCRDAMEETCGKIKKGQREDEIAGGISRAFLERDIIPTVVLIAADGRIKKYRHPIFTGKRARRSVMVVVCGRRKGLILSLTRLVHFGSVPAALKRKHEAVATVDAAFILSSQIGRSLGAVFAAGIAAYRDRGFADEWKLHHQGGPTGYAGRDILATPGDRHTIVPNQALAWNPSITGTKSEDTIIATEKGPVILSPPLNWPTIMAEWRGKRIERADILII